MRPLPLRKFFLPSLTRAFLLRVLLLSISCLLIFNYLLIPLRIQGQSMEPTYRDNSFAFCWRLQYLFSKPARSDVVTLRYAGRKVMLLKRIIALAGDTVAFRKGILFVNGQRTPEPYVRYTSNWDLSERTIKPGHVYVVGDNRNTIMSRHRFGQIPVNRIIGGVIP